MIYTDIGLCSQALLKIGAATISSFEDGSSEAEVAANLYPLLRDGLLSVYPWSFASAQCALPRLTEMPVADYRYAYRLPPDLLRIVSAGIGERGQGLEYRIRENALHTNADKVVLSYLFRPAEKNFPAFFLRCVGCTSGGGVLSSPDRELFPGRISGQKSRRRTGPRASDGFAAGYAAPL